MIHFHPKDIQDRRRVVLRGKVVTIIDLAGSKARIAEDGKWYEHEMFFPLTGEQLQQEFIDEVKEQIAGKTIASVKTVDTGIQVILTDNTRLEFCYTGQFGVFLSVVNSDGKRVL